jgi:hypothetical protein
MKALTLILTLTCLLLTSCSRDPADVVNPHDTKYRALTQAGDLCVLDTQTGLVWQTKTLGAGLNSAANSYSWFGPNEANGELDYRGLEDGGVCDGSACDTWHYVQAVNAQGYCGHNDWRMPNKDEMYSISDILRAKTPPTINTDFFPNARAAEYWSGNDYSFQWDAAWAWNFELGHDRVDWKKEAKFIRLVRGTAGDLESVKE